MKIKRIELENFKSAPNGEIALDRLNVLIGENGRGKTSIQNAFRYLLNGTLPVDPIRHGCDHLRVGAVLDDGNDTKMERLMYLSDTYQINDVNVKEKDFLKEVKKYHELYQSSGTALQTGKRTNPYFRQKPDEVMWEFMLKGKVEGSRMFGLKELELELADGTNLYMCRSQPSKAMIDGKKVTAKAYTEFIKDRMQGDVKSLDIVTSSEVMNAMEMTDFAKYLISIVPVNIDFTKLVDLAELSKKEEEILKPFFPTAPNPITTSDVASAYKSIFNIRTEVARQMEEWKMRSVYQGALPMMDKQVVQEKIEESNQKLGAAAQLSKAWEVYDHRLRERQTTINTLQEMIAEYNKMGRILKPDDSVLQQIRTQKEQAQRYIEADVSSISRLKQSNIPLQKMVTNLDSTVCPLCDKLVCSTDKTGCKKDLEDIISNNNQMIAEAEARVISNRAAFDKLQQSENAFMDQKRLFERKYTLYMNIESMKKSIPAEPPKPETLPDMEVLKNTSQKYNQYLREITIYEECLKALETYNEFKAQHELYNGLVRKTEPKKGLLTNTILTCILEPFSNHVNDFVKSIFGDMEISFRMDDDGLQVYCRPHGRTSFVLVKALSTGERMLAVFSLMDMVANVSNTRILVFDSLEALDTNALGKLFEVLVSSEVQNRYDHILLSVVNHESIRKMVDKYSNCFNVVEVQ